MQKKLPVSYVWNEDGKLKVGFDCYAEGYEHSFGNRLWVDMENDRFCFGDCYEHCRWMKCVINKWRNTERSGKHTYSHWVYEIFPEDSNIGIVLVDSRHNPCIRFFHTMTGDEFTGKKELTNIVVMYILQCATDRYGWAGALERYAEKYFPGELKSRGL